MATAQTVSQTTAALSVAELEALIRRVVREGVNRALEPGAPIYNDLVETLRMAEAGTLKILSREEALSADQ